MKTVFFESLRYKLITKKMIFITALVLIFILRLRFPKGKSVAAIITRRYGRQLLTLFRECEN